MCVQKRILFPPRTAATNKLGNIVSGTFMLM